MYYMTKKKIPIDPTRIISLLLLGIVLLIALYVVFLIKIGRLNYKWNDTRVGICHKNTYGLKLDQNEIIRLPFLEDSSVCL